MPMPSEWRVARPRAAQRASSPRPSGFSLLELLIVVAILGLLAALVFGRLGGELGESKVKTTRVQLESLSQAVDRYQLHVGRYPTEEQGLAALIEQPDDAESWKGPYLGKTAVPTDGWNRPFVYEHDEQFGFVIRSLGADGAPGGEGENADIDNRS